VVGRPEKRQQAPQCALGPANATPFHHLACLGNSVDGILTLSCSFSCSERGISSSCRVKWIQRSALTVQESAVIHRHTPSACPEALVKLLDPPAQSWTASIHWRLGIKPPTTTESATWQKIENHLKTVYTPWRKKNRSEGSKGDPSSTEGIGEGEGRSLFRRNG
jgi:hypothetical protein